MVKLHPAYVAGIIDGEGCICIDKQLNRGKGWSPNYGLQVQVVNTNLEVLSRLQEQFSGRIHTKTKYLTQRQCFVWVLPVRNQREFLKVILPYLVIKTAQAKIGLEFLANKKPIVGKRGQKLPQRTIDFRESLHIRMKQLNHNK